MTPHRPPPPPPPPRGPPPPPARRPRALRDLSLRARLTLSAALFVLAAIVVTGVLIGTVLERFVRGEVAGRLDLQIATLQTALLTPPPPDEPRRGRRPPEPPSLARALAEVDGAPFDRPRGDWFWQVDVDGRMLARSRSLGGRDLVHEDDASSIGGGPDRLDLGCGPDGQAIVLREDEIALPGGREARILVAAPRGAIDNPLRDVTLQVAATLAGLGALLVAAIFAQVRFGLKPLDRLRTALVRVRSGERETVEGRYPAELEPLQRELNALIEQDAANLRQSRLHVANLAHGLKTPLATLSAAAERLPDPDARARFLDLSALMDRRVRHHLRRARSAALGGPVRQRTDLARHAEDLASTLRKFDPRVAIETRPAPGLFVAVDQEDLDEMLGNLLDNACRHASGRVVLETAQEGAQAVVRIADDGRGLSTDEIAAVLQPGRRLDETRPGHGFGLPITAEIAGLYGGRLALGRAPEGGLEVRLTLPLSAAGA
ncbi:sensor histidine kinase [Aureimonas phyllosphaerae]|uniref:histidine kinase n=1 Tax=Aureimonas phyllosphaerae TaxID=1166078 RepID=A0A7W6C137_9HYPH|nr:HAMP domain-containing sensor histidine kinase [Aureimonas phyllosphaerae]MBB3937466.1 signal transduction histidine kinase [Aureimonas phyllosphaerae]MBB3961468.1 signal transduction histidine kinase [Aureimonas phyllosphaerae]SFF38460.1 Signal transduction histidine kinase [Aureimonas phyllosphaerae]